MISRRPLYSVLIGAVLAAGALSAILYWRTQPTLPVVGQTADTQPVLVASHDIPFGTKLTPDLFQQVSWPRASVPAGAIASSAEVLSGPKGQRIAIRSFVAGEPLLRSKISDFGERPTLSRRVSLNMRAYAVRVNDVTGVAGFPVPGDRVDVLLARTDAKGVTAAEVVLQNVKVLGIDQIASEDADQPVVAKTATVEVTPEEAQTLALAGEQGSLSLALRNYADAARLPLGKLILDNSAPVVTAPTQGPVVAATGGARRQAPRRPEVTVRRGTSVSIEQVSGQ
jgi:pilus assembly protein CpaB